MKPTKWTGRGSVLATALAAVVMALMLGACNLNDEDNENDKTVSLSKETWTDGKISKDGQTKNYTFTVTQGTRYFVYMNNAWDGDGKMTGYTGMKILHSDGTEIRGWYNDVLGCWTEPVTFVASSTGTVTITVASCVDGSWAATFNGANWEKGTGTYAIKYTVASIGGGDLTSDDN